MGRIYIWSPPRCSNCAKGKRRCKPCNTRYCRWQRWMRLYRKEGFSAIAAVVQEHLAIAGDAVKLLTIEMDDLKSKAEASQK